MDDAGIKGGSMGRATRHRTQHCLLRGGKSQCNNRMSLNRDEEGHREVWNNCINKVTGKERELHRMKSKFLKCSEQCYSFKIFQLKIPFKKLHFKLHKKTE